MTTGNRDRLTADRAPQLQEGDDRSGEGDRTDEDANEDLDFMNQHLACRNLDAGFDVAGDSDQHRGETDEAVQHRNQFGHSRHRHACRQHRADHDCRNDPDRHRRVTAGHHAKNRRSDRQQHADDAQHVASPGGRLMRQPSQAEDEQHAGHDVGDGRHRLIQRNRVACRKSGCSRSARSVSIIVSLA